jgi:hypothetical protein
MWLSDGLTRTRQAIPDMFGEEDQNPLPGIGCRNEFVVAPVVIEEGMLGSGATMASGLLT